MKEEKDIKNNIKAVLEKVRPSLQADGGDVELVEWDEKEGVVKVRMLGMCAGCPMAQLTLQEGIAKEIMKELPEVNDVVAV